MRAHLLRHPQLCPELFEDLAGSIQGAEDRLTASLDAIKAQLADVAGQTRENAALATLIREASVHYERGRDHQEAEQLQHAASSLSDALRLVDDHADQMPGGVLLRARVLTLLSGIEGTTGRFTQAIEHGRRAVEAAENFDDALLRIYSLGNLAAALSRTNRPTEARPLFERTLSNAEELGDVIEIVRTRTYLLEVDAALGDRPALFEGIEQLDQILTKFHAVHEPRPITIAALGQCANAMLELSNNDPQIMKQALAIFEAVEQTATGSHRHLMLSSRSQRARCSWFLDNLKSAAELYASVEEEGSDEYPGISADACFNLALVISETGDRPAAEACMLRARDRYAAIENDDEVQNAEKQLRLLRSGAYGPRSR